MPKHLYIKWTPEDHFNHYIVDEQHRGLISIINSLYYFIQSGWEISSLKPTILMLEQYVIFHLKTEELILIEKGIPHKQLTIVQDYGKEFLEELRGIVNSSIQHKEPNEVISFLSKWWLGHKTQFHEKLIKYITH